MNDMVQIDVHFRLAVCINISRSFYYTTENQIGAINKIACR